MALTINNQTPITTQFEAESEESVALGKILSKISSDLTGLNKKVTKIDDKSKQWGIAIFIITTVALTALSVTLLVISGGLPVLLAMFAGAYLMLPSCFTGLIVGELSRRSIKFLLNSQQKKTLPTLEKKIEDLKNLNAEKEKILKSIFNQPIIRNKFAEIKDDRKKQTLENLKNLMGLIEKIERQNFKKRQERKEKLKTLSFLEAFNILSQIGKNSL
jgi:hypothetical protein